MEVREVSNRRDLNRFVRLPWKIYADDPCWVPPLLLDVKEFLDPRRHPFYLHGEATQFLALDDGQTIGRILVSDDPIFNRRQGASQGCFGMFECVDDPRAAKALLDAAADWLARRGRTSMVGPVDYSINYAVGLLIDGFDTPPRILMNHHRPYYAKLLEAAGLAKAKDLYAWWFVDPHDMIQKWRRRADRLAQRGGFSVRPFDKKNFAAEMKQCHDVYNRALGEHWGFVKLTDAEFEHLAKRIDRIAIAQHVLLAEVDGKPVGFSVTVPDLNEAIRPLNGRLTTWGLPIGLLRLPGLIRRVKTGRMMVLVLLEEHRRKGIAESMILRTLDFGKNTLGYAGAELGWTLEDNEAVNRVIERVGGERYKTYRIYEKQIG